MRSHLRLKPFFWVLAVLGGSILLPRGGQGRALCQHEHGNQAGAQMQQQQQQMHPGPSRPVKRLVAAIRSFSSSKALPLRVGGSAAEAAQHARPQRSLLQFRPSADEQHTKHAAKVSAWHATGVTLMCLLAMAVLGFMGYKAMQWYERARRPGYVELQAVDTAFHKPTFTL